MWKEEKSFVDPDSGIGFRLQWNPDRELRHDRQLLIERKVIADVDKTKLIQTKRENLASYASIILSFILSNA